MRQRRCDAVRDPRCGIWGAVSRAPRGRLARFRRAHLACPARTTSTRIIRRIVDCKRSAMCHVGVFLPSAGLRPVPMRDDKRSLEFPKHRVSSDMPAEPVMIPTRTPGTDDQLSPNHRRATTTRRAARPSKTSVIASATASAASEMQRTSRSSSSSAVGDPRSRQPLRVRHFGTHGDPAIDFSAKQSRTTPSTPNSPVKTPRDAEQTVTGRGRKGDVSTPYRRPLAKQKRSRHDE